MGASTKSMSTSQINRFIRMCEEQGIAVTRTKKGLMIRFPDGTSTVQHFSTSDVRAEPNQIARFRRAGMVHPNDPRPPKDLPAYITGGTITAKTRQRLVQFVVEKGYPEAVLAGTVVKELGMDPTMTNRALYHTGFRPGIAKNRKVGRPWFTPESILALKEERHPVVEAPDMGLDNAVQDYDGDPESGLTDFAEPEPTEHFDGEDFVEPEPPVVLDSPLDEVPEDEPIEPIQFDPPLTDGESEAYEEAMHPAPAEPSPEVHIENGREFIDSADSWAVDMEALLGVHLNRMVRDRLSVLTAVGIEYEVRVWRKK